MATVLALALTWALVVAAPGVSGAQSGEVFPVGSSDGDATLLAQQMTAQPFVLQGARFQAHPPASGVHGLGQGIAGFPVQGGFFSILTTGQVEVAVSDPDDYPDGFALGGGNVRGNTDFDVTILEIDFVPPSGATCLRFDFRFLSHEYPDWVGSAYNDAFIAELNVTSWITSGSQIIAPNNFAFDGNGDVISINTTGATSMSEAHAEGTGYGGGTPLLTASTPVPPDEAGTLYLSIFDQGDMILDSAVFLDNLRFTFDTGDACLEGAQPADPDPIVFVPGITGSALADAATGEEIWPSPGQLFGPPIGDTHLRQLMLDTDGQTPHPEHGVEVVATDIMRKVLVQDIYDGFIQQLAAAGYVEGQNLSVVPLDWRRSAEHNALVLLDAIDGLGGGGKVNVVAHSQGGLVTAAALSNPAFDNVGKVGRVVTLGTPYLGAAKALGVLEYAEPCFIRIVLCWTNRARMQEISQNMPGFLELLPSRNYDAAVGSALRTEDGAGLSFDQVRGRLADSGRNMPLLQAADLFHQQYDAWSPADPDVELFRIAASGLPTIYAVQERATWWCSVRRWFGGCEEANDIEFVHGSGDSTVATASAGLYNDAGFDLRGSGVTGWTGPYDHTGMVTDPRIVQEVLRVLQRPSGQQAAFAATGAAQRPVLDGFSVQQSDDDVLLDEPVALSGLEVFAQGPVEATMTGADGSSVSTFDAEDHPDVEGALAQPLPGAVAFQTRFSRTVFATEDGSYTTTLVAVSDGVLTVSLRVWEDDGVVTAVAYPALGVAEGAVVTVEHAVPLDGPPALLVDEDGDGTVDLVVEAASVVDGEAAADRIPPVTSAEVVRITDPDDPLDGHALVELSATDEGGSGVDRIEYAILPDEVEGTYDGTPVLLAPSQSLLARAVDRAGNVEVPPLHVDIDGADDRELVDGYATPQFIGAARLTEPGQQHWWGFEVTSATHEFALQGLQADYDLAVYDEDDQLVAATTERGTQSKQLRVDLEAGRYYALVSGHDDAYDPVSDYLVRVTRLGRGHSR